MTARALAELGPDDREALRRALPVLATVAAALDRQESARVTGVDAITLRGVSHRFGDHLAVDGVDLTVAPGEFFGLLGPNGAGKTTTIRLITTLLPVQQGEVQVFGTTCGAGRWRCAGCSATCRSSCPTDAALTGRENVALFARLFDVPRRERGDRVAEVLAMVDLADAADRLAKTYSGGMVRRLELAQALVSPPRAAGARRADHRPRPDRPRQRVGAHRRDAARHRHDRAGHHALHGGGRRALRPGRADAPRRDPRRSARRPS